MKNGDHIIIGIHVHNRMQHAPQVQHVLTDYGRYIKTRVGLHEIDGGEASGNGLILVELVADRVVVDAFIKALSAIDGVHVKDMIFTH